jgi:exonuclease SbcC
MKLANLLFKPKWQDKNPDVRRVAVANDSDPALLAALPELTRADPESSVRLAALKRLDEYELWRERSTGDADPALRKSARAVYITQLCADLPSGPALPRRIAELETLSNDELEKVAAIAVRRELRADALTRITKPNFLVERALNDADPMIRLDSLQRVTDPALLEKIAERARKTDKVISRRARELAEAARVGSGDIKVIAERARALCERAEAIMRSATAQRAEQLALLDDEWKKLGASIPQEIVSRYEGTRAVILAPPPRPTVVEPIERPEIVAAAETPSPAPHQTESLVSRSRFDAALAAAQAETQRLKNIRTERLRQLSDILPSYEAAIDAGDSATTMQLRKRIDAIAESAGDLPPSLREAVTPLHDRATELQRWLTWSANQRRKAICAEIESLPPATHPDALASRIRECRDEWQKLSTTSAAPEALEKRFQGLSHRLLKTTRSYFDKRDELRRSQSDAINQLLTRADADTDGDVDWKALTALRNELSASLRNLDRVDPRERTTFAKRIKSHLDRFDTRITEHYDSVMNAKSRLIERAKVLTAATDARDIARQARDLQTQWTGLGNGRRNTDQKQWREFRQACDAAFGRLDTQRKERDEQTAVQRAQAVSLIEEVEALASSDANADALRAAQRDIVLRWDNLGVDDRSLEQRYRQARENITRAIGDAARKRRLSRFAIALHNYDLLRQSSEDRISDLWQQTGQAPTDLEKSLQSRRERSSELASSQSTDAVADILVRLEFMAGVESPAADKQRRLDHQVKRLSSRLRGNDAGDSETELAALMCEWFALESEPTPEHDRRFRVAVGSALDNLP